MTDASGATTKTYDGEGNAAQKTDAMTLHAGEDLSNDVQKTEHRFDGKTYTAAEDGEALMPGPGLLECVTVMEAGATGNAIIIYDGSDATGPAVFSQTPPVAGTYWFRRKMNIGLFVTSAGTTAPKFSVTYRGD